MVDLPAGHEIVASDLDPYENACNAWTSFVPAWGASVTNPAIGNGTIVGYYRQVGKTVDVYIRISMGSTTTYGSGNWSLTLPVNALRDTTLVGLAIDNTAPTASRPVACQVNASGGIFRMHTAGGIITSTVPFTWATSDSLTISGSYEVA